ncbi:MAG: glycerophosphodiester phosphodiesterase [Halieaceae bacterium]|jgi:glycerophosphoryl diester phosphodiesterase|nr:glycerophosphodiester phosphodiesterase [Halieaceae bacterium]
MSKSPVSRPIVIAHRGASGYLPEHTLAAKAMAHAMDADYIEQDVVLSRDGIPVVLHDVYLESTTDVARRFPGRARADGRFYAMDFLLEELRELRVHERSDRDRSGGESAVYPGRFPLAPALFGIPTLAEEIDLIAGLDRSRGRTTGLYVELKGPNLHLGRGMDIAERVLEVLAEKGYADRPQQVYLQCFDGPTLQRLRHEMKTPLPLIQLIGENSWGEDSESDYDYMRSPEGLAQVAGYADGIGPWLAQVYLGRSPSGEIILSDLVNRAQALGLAVHPYTFRRDELPAGLGSFDELLDIFFRRAGVDGVFTDFPDTVRHYLQREGYLNPAG